MARDRKPLCLKSESLVVKNENVRRSPRFLNSNLSPNLTTCLHNEITVPTQNSIPVNKGHKRLHSSLMMVQDEKIKKNFNSVSITNCLQRVSATALTLSKQLFALS